MFHVLAPLLFALPMVAADEADAGRGPKPSPHPISWEFEFSFLDPQRIEIQLPGVTAPETYWYVVYTVTNNSGRTQHFFPMFQIVTENLRVYDTDMGIHPLVFDAIRERHGRTHKFLVDPTKAIGPLLAGEDHARQSVAIWRQIDLNVNKFSVYVAGLCGEAQFVPNPAYDPQRPESETVTTPDGRQVERATNPKHFTLRKTLEIRYTLSSSPLSRPTVAPERDELRWIMR